MSSYSHKARLGFIAFLAAAAIGSPAAWSQETTRKGESIALIELERVPLTDAIKNLARQTGRNYILDPRLSGPWWVPTASLPESRPLPFVGRT